MRLTNKKGFTLVEILIVVVILGILAAIVIPQFSNASSQAKESSLVSNLQAVRSQIQMYKIEHNDTLPGTATGVTFIQALTEKTDASGAIDGTDDFGPYMKSVPVNSFVVSTTNKYAADGINGSVTVATDAADTLPSDDGSSWWFNTATGAFAANDSFDSPADADTDADHKDL